MPITAENLVQEFDIAVEARPAYREGLINGFAGFTQFVTWPFLFVLFKIFFSITIKGNEIFDRVEKPFVIVSNHVDFYHSFLFRLVLGPLTPHLPLRFMAVRHFKWRSLNILSALGIIDFIYSLFGVFTVIPGQGIDRNLARAREIIADRGNIVIYPEGQIYTSGGVGSFKKGTAVLVRQTGVTVIPVSFRLTGKSWWRKGIEVNVGRPISNLRHQSIGEITDTLHDAVEKLYWRR